MRILKMLKLCIIMRNNLSYFLLYYQACIPENDIVSVETYRGNHEFNLISRTYGIILVDCTVIMYDILDYNVVHYNKTNLLNK
jgi:hypothetical protein